MKKIILAQVLTAKGKTEFSGLYDKHGKAVQSGEMDFPVMAARSSAFITIPYSIVCFHYFGRFYENCFAGG